MVDPVLVTARLIVRPESREAFVEGARACIDATRREAGCLFYDLHESITEPGSFVYVEQWRDRAALDAHMAETHLRAFVGIALTCLAAPPVIEAVDGGTRWRLA